MDACLTKALQSLALIVTILLGISSSIYKPTGLFKFNFSYAYDFYSKELTLHKK